LQRENTETAKSVKDMKRKKEEGSSASNVDKDLGNVQ